MAAAALTSMAAPRAAAPRVGGKAQQRRGAAVVTQVIVFLVPFSMPCSCWTPRPTSTPFSPVHVFRRTPTLPLCLTPFTMIHTP